MNWKLESLQKIRKLYIKEPVFWSKGSTKWVVEKCHLFHIAHIEQFHYNLYVDKVLSFLAEKLLHYNAFSSEIHTKVN